ncbi:MAG: glycosyltransferase, partial [Caldilineaceae bacterium]|nr:glycosyltransferase [Caldilineaceae bacterium]
AAYAEEYIANLKAKAAGDPRIIFTGYVFGQGYHELGSNAYIFVETSGVGGTHPALVEAMAFGNCVITYNTPENLETIGEAGFGYDGNIGADALRQLLQYLLQNPDVVQEYAHKATHRAHMVYSWESVTDEYERLFYQLRGQPLPQRLQSYMHA